MFSSKNDTALATAPGAARVSPRQTRVGPAIVGSDVVVEGTLNSTGEIQIDGRLNGDVRCASLMIGGQGEIYGEIVAGEVIVRGRVKGPIRAHKVLLCASSRLEGDVLCGALAIEAGAFFEGNCRHSDDLAETVPKTAAEGRAAAVGL